MYNRKLSIEDYTKLMELQTKAQKILSDIGYLFLNNHNHKANNDIDKLKLDLANIILIEKQRTD